MRPPQSRSGTTAPLRLGTLALFLALVAACRTAPTSSEIVLATVDQQPLTLADALDTFLSTHSGHGALVQGEAAVRELTGRIVERRLFLDEARTLGLEDAPEVQEAVLDYAHSQAALIFWRQAEEGVSVSDEEVEAFYSKTDMVVRCSLIVAASEQEAAALRERVVAGEDFAELAEAASIDEDTRSFGGMLPFAQRGDLEPALETEAFALEEPGQLSPVVEVSNGWGFLRLEERITNPNRPSREEALPQIRSVLEQRASENRRQEVEQRILAEAGAEVEEALLTRERLLAEGDDEVVVGRSGGESLTLGDCRNRLDLEKVAAAPPEDVAEAAVAMVRDWTLERAVRRAVEQEGLLEDPMVRGRAERYREDAVLTLLCHDYVYAEIDPSEEDVRAYYEEHIESSFTRPAEVRMAYILVPDVEEAAVIQERLAAGEVFADLARELSQDKTSAMHGGRIGWAREGSLRLEVEERAFSVPIGSFDGPIVTDDGVYLLQILDRKERLVVPFEVAQRAARRRLVEQLQGEAWMDWAARLKERADIRLHQEGIDQAVTWLASQAPAAPPEGPPAPEMQPGVQAPPGHGGGAAP